MPQNVFQVIVVLLSGQLFDFNYLSLSNIFNFIKSGIISAIFQDSGKVDVVNELLMMSVNGPSMTGRQSLIIRMLILSGPRDLFDGIVVIMRCTSVHVTGVNLNNSV
jgi:hypothetical protein